MATKQAKAAPAATEKVEVKKKVGADLPPIVTMAPGITPSSQKARGIMGLGDIVVKHRQHFPDANLPHHFLIQSASDLDSDEWKNHDLAKKEKLFVRPCPSVPRHGFTESRPIEGNGQARGQILSILDEARQADPKSELLITEPVATKWSAIWTPHFMAFGPGNDGATSGNTFLKLPLPGTNPFAEVQAEYGITAPDVPYLELLASEELQLTLVQFRGGPATGLTSANYVPADMVVKRTFQAQGSLLDHEALIKSLKPGDVVYRMGDSLVSHYAAHCVAHQIPYVTDHVPVVGEHLQQTTDTIPPYDMVALRQGLQDGYSYHVKEDTTGDITKMGVVATHYSQFWRTGDSAVALGRFASLLVRVAGVLCMNETKYLTPKLPEHSELTKMTADFPGGGRNAVYFKYINQQDYVREMLRKCLDGFMYGGYSGGYGGIKWGECAIHAVDLDNLIHSIMTNTDPSLDQELASSLSIKMHGLINASHNNGKLFTKVLNNGFLDKMATGGTKSALELMILYAHTVWERQKAGGFVDPKQPVYQWKSKPAPAASESWWNGAAWISLEEKLKLQNANAEPKKAEAITAPEPEKKKKVWKNTDHEWNITCQIRVNGDQMRFQMRKQKIAPPLPDLIAELEPVSPKKKSAAKKGPQLYNPPPPPNLYKGFGGSVDDEGEESHSNPAVSKLKSLYTMQHTEKDLTMSVNETLKSRIENNKTNPSVANTNVKYHNMDWKYWDEERTWIVAMVSNNNMVWVKLDNYPSWTILTAAPAGITPDPATF